MSATVGNVSSATPLGSGSSISWNHTSNSNTIEITVGNADGSGGGPITSITVNGTTATILGQIQNSSYFAICQAVLTGVPTSGTLAIVVTLTSGGGAGIFASARSVIGVDQTTPTRTTATNFGIADQAANVAATSVAGDLVLGGINVYSTTNSTVTGTSDWYATGGALTLISGRGLESVASGTSTTLAATGGGGGENKWVAIATAFIAASATVQNMEVENSARPRPGRGPLSPRSKGFRVASIDAYTTKVAAALQGDAIDVAIATGGLTTFPNIAQTDWGQSRNRPGRGPLSTGRFFLPSIDAFKISASAALQGDAVSIVTAAANLSTAIQLAGSATDSATATASLSTAIKLAVNAIAQANASGSLTTAIILAGNASDVVTATGSLGGTAAALSGAAADTVIATGQLLTGIPLAGSAIDNATATGGLSTQIQLQAAAQAIAIAAAGLTTQIQMVGAAIDSAIATGSISGGALLSGAAQAISIASGSLTTAIQLLGSAADQATAAGSLSTGIKIAGNAIDTSTATGSLQSSAAALVGAAQSIVTVIGLLTTGISLGGGATVIASASGALNTSIRLFGAAQSAVTATGALTTIALYYASALTLRVPKRDYTLSIPRRDYIVTLH